MEIPFNVCSQSGPSFENMLRIFFELKFLECNGNRDKVSPELLPFMENKRKEISDDYVYVKILYTCISSFVNRLSLHDYGILLDEFSKLDPKYRMRTCYIRENVPLDHPLIHETSEQIENIIGLYNF